MLPESYLSNSVAPPFLSMSPSTAFMPNISTSADPFGVPIRRRRIRCRRHLNERERVLLFVKVLLRFLECSNNKKLKKQAKAIVFLCVRRNRMGDPNFTPLKHAVEDHLHTIVGDELFFFVKTYCDFNCERKGLMPIAAV